MAEGVTYVFSHNPADAKAVATEFRPYNGVNSAAVQVVALADARSNTLVTVGSLAQAQPLHVQLRGPVGEPLFAHSVWVANTPSVAQAGAPWSVVGTTTVVGSLTAGITGTVTVTGSVGATVTGSILASQGGAPWSVIGSVGVTQVTSPWVTLPGSTGAFQGFVVASVVGQTTTTASVVGQVTVTASVIGTVTAAVTQTTSPWIVQQASTGQFVGFVVASVIGGGSQVTVTNTPTANVLQVTSPWVVQQGSTGQFVGFVVASIVGGGSSVTVTNTPTANVLQVSSPWITQAASTGQFIGFAVVSVVGGGTSVSVVNTPSVNVLQVTSPWIVQQGSTGQFVGFVVASVVGGGSQVTVTNTPTVNVLQVSSPWITQAASTGQFIGFAVVSVVGGGTSVTVTNTPTVNVLQVSSPWSVIAASGSVFTGSVTATQGGAPWTFTGSAVVQGSVQATIAGSISGNVVASVVGQPTVTASIIGFPTVIASARIEGALAHDLPWLTLQPVGQGGYALHPNSGAPVSVGSGDVVRALHDLEGRAYVYVSSGEVGARQVGAPWTVVGSQTVVGSVFATVSSITGTVVGSVLASQGGAPWSTVGSAWVTNTPTVNALQVSSPWIVQQASTGQFVGFVVASIVGGGSSIVGSVWVSNTPSAVVVNTGFIATGPIPPFSTFVDSAAPATYPLLIGGMSGGTTQTDPSPVAFGRAVHLLMSPQGHARVAVNSGFVTAVASVIGQPTFTASVIGQVTVTASISGTPSVVASARVEGLTAHDGAWLALQPVGIGGFAVHPNSGMQTPVTSGDVVRFAADLEGRQYVAGSIQATVAGSVFATVSSINGTIVGSVLASQGGSPWNVVGSTWVTNTPTVNAIQVSSPWVVIGASGSIVTGSVTATQGGSPWGVVGSVWVSNSPLVIFAGSTGAFAGFHVASVIGQPTVTASVIGFPTVVASCIGQQTVTASVIGQPTFTASVVGQVTVTASIAGAISTIQGVGGFTLNKIAWEVSSSLPFPWDGLTSQVRSATTNEVGLATDVLSSDLTGLAVMIVSSSTALNQVRAISGLGSGNKWSNGRIVTITPNWDVTPSSGNTYRLLVDARSAQQLTCRTEISSAVAGTGASRVYYSFGLFAPVTSGNLGVIAYPQNLPEPLFDGLRAVDPIPTSFGVRQASYWPAEGQSVLVTGFVGAKVYVTSAAQNFSLWAGTRI